MLDQSLDVKDFHILNEQLIQLEYQTKDDFLAPDQITNIFVATFTTCWARLKLYGVLDMLGERCLYYDTDSVIYVNDGTVHVPLGDYLGDLTNELRPGHHIVEFISGGPKNYGYLEDDGECTLKVKGFRLNHANSQVINFESVKEMVLTKSQDSLSVTDPRHITRDKYAQKVISVPQTKNYKIVYTKRRVLDDLNTLPYGY